MRETKTEKVVSREEVEERTETEDIKHLGDFSDEVNSIYLHNFALEFNVNFGIFF